MVDGSRWLDAQPDLITCPGTGTRMTLRACQKRLKSQAHYATKVSDDPDDGMEVTYSFRPCRDANCEHYLPTTKRAKCYRKSGGNNKPLSARLDSQIFNAWEATRPAIAAKAKAADPNIIPVRD